MPDLLAGTTIKGQDTPATVANAQATTITTLSITFAVSGTDCAVVFVAPTTGRVKIHSCARMVNTSATSGTIIAPETRTGSTIGSGTVVEAAADTNGPSHYGSTFSSIGRAHLLTGLTPGATYNARLLMRTSNAADTATFANREIIVEPAT